MESAQIRQRLTGYASISVSISGTAKCVRSRPVEADHIHEKNPPSIIWFDLKYRLRANAAKYKKSSRKNGCIFDAKAAFDRSVLLS